MQVVARYTMTWDGALPVSVIQLRAFAWALCSAEQHLPNVFSKLSFLIHTNNASHSAVAARLRKVPGSSERRLLNVDLAAQPALAAFARFRSWLSPAGDTPNVRSPRYFGSLRVDDFASVRRLLVDVSQAEAGKAYLCLGADVVFLRPPATLAAEVAKNPTVAYYMVAKHGQNDSGYALSSHMGPSCPALSGDFFFVPAGAIPATLADGHGGLAEAETLLRGFATACGSTEPEQWLGPTTFCDTPERFHAIDQFVWSMLLGRWARGGCRGLDSQRFAGDCLDEPRQDIIEAAHGRIASCALFDKLQQLPAPTASDAACRALGIGPPKNETKT